MRAPLAATLGITVVAVLVCAAAFLVAFPQRTDYAGHFVAGAGGNAVLLGMAIAFAQPREWVIVGVTVVAIILGVGTEATVFKIAIFDVVDLGSQSLGALVVACGLFGSHRSGALGASVVSVGLLLLVAGFRLAFA